MFSLNLRQNWETGAQNLEVTYHVLLTVTALNEDPVKNYWYLPTVSLGRELDKHIPWGATVPTKNTKAIINHNDGSTSIITSEDIK